MHFEAFIRREEDGSPAFQSNFLSNYMKQHRQQRHQVDRDGNINDERTATLKLAFSEENQQILTRKSGQDTTQLGDSTIGRLADKSTGNKPPLVRLDEEQRDQHLHLAATAEDASASTEPDQVPSKPQLVWANIIVFALLHLSIPVGVYMLYSQRPWKTLIFSIVSSYAATLGITGGSHRLWSHRSYKAKWPVQVFLGFLQTLAGQYSIYTWARDHRMHHKYEETNADPRNIKRGFFFAHIGWLCCKKHPELIEKGKSIDMSDLEANPYVMFQRKHFVLLFLVLGVLLPTMVPILLWGERFWTSLVFSFMIRYLLSLHTIFIVNSVAHYYGNRPYDNRIEARQSWYANWATFGEGFHNYHHTFPYDYAASEFGRYMNFTTTFIDFCALLGLVHDRRKINPESIMNRRIRTGDLKEKRQY